MADPNQPLQPPGVSTAPTPSGTLPWALGLISLAAIPFLSAFVAGVVMGIVGLAQRRKGPLASVNGRSAANWGFTYALVTLLLGAAHITLLVVLTRDGPQTTFFPIGIPLTLWLVISVVHVVVCIRGIVVTGRLREFAPPAIPIVLR